MPALKISRMSWPQNAFRKEKRGRESIPPIPEKAEDAPSNVWTEKQNGDNVEEERPDPPPLNGDAEVPTLMEKAVVSLSETLLGVKRALSAHDHAHDQLSVEIHHLNQVVAEKDAEIKDLRERLDIAEGLLAKPTQPVNCITNHDTIQIDGKELVSEMIEAVRGVIAIPEMQRFFKICEIVALMHDRTPNVYEGQKC